MMCVKFLDQVGVSHYFEVEHVTVFGFGQEGVERGEKFDGEPVLLLSWGPEEEAPELFTVGLRRAGWSQAVSCRAQGCWLMGSDGRTIDNLLAAGLTLPYG